MDNDQRVIRLLLDEISEAIGKLDWRDFRLFKDSPDQLPDDPCIVSDRAVSDLLALKILAENPQSTMEWGFGLDEGSLKSMSYGDALRLRLGEINLPDGLKPKPKTLIVG